MKIRSKRRKDANLLLATDTTTAFIEHLSKVIDDDVSTRGRYLKKYWLTKYAIPLRDQLRCVERQPLPNGLPLSAGIVAPTLG